MNIVRLIDLNRMSHGCSPPWVRPQAELVYRLIIPRRRRNALVGESNSYTQSLQIDGSRLPQGRSTSSMSGQ